MTDQTAEWCPTCGAEFETESFEATEPEEPEEGGLSICGKCRVVIVREGPGWRPLTQGEFDALPMMDLYALIRAARALARYYGGPTYFQVGVREVRQ